MEASFQRMSILKGFLYSKLIQQGPEGDVYLRLEVHGDFYNGDVGGVDVNVLEL